MPDDIQIGPYQKKSDFKTIRSWMRSRQMCDIGEDQLPRLGYVASWDNEPVAALFLRRCEGELCSFDSLITDPSAPSAIRDVVLDRLIGYCIDKAREFNFRGIISYSLDNNTKERVINRHGFQSMPATLLWLSIA